MIGRAKPDHAAIEYAIAADRRRLLGEVEAMRRHITQCRSRGTTIWVPLLDVQLLLQKRDTRS